jgi:anthranilate phosphoribosyltransferase
MKLLIALDALLREGSVSAAAASMGMQISAMSRMLAQLREFYGDPLLERTGQGMRPTPFAEALRLEVRGLANDAELLLARTPESAAALPWGSHHGPGSNSARALPQHQASHQATPLAPGSGAQDRVEGEPSPQMVAERMALISHASAPDKRLAKCIASIAAGPGRTRPLTQEEARDALGIILRGEADPFQTGALLAALQMRGMTATELAGFAEAIDLHALLLSGGERLQAGLNWPAYMSPRRRLVPWFIHAARLVSMAGYRVLIHGFGGRVSSGAQMMQTAEDGAIPVIETMSEAQGVLNQEGIAYLPVSVFSPQVEGMLALYPSFEMRNPVHSAVHLLNPGNAAASMLGAAQTSDRELFRTAAALTGCRNAAVTGSNRDFAQIVPDRPTPIFRLADGEETNFTLPSAPGIRQPVPAALSLREYWLAVWTGAARDELAEAAIVKTAALALLTLRKAPEEDFSRCLEEATALWRNRPRQLRPAGAASVRKP